MGAHAEIVVPRYVVLTRLADSWIPRASHADPDTAEADAFRWRRIYGPSHTRVAQFWVPERPHHHHATVPPVAPPTSSVAAITGKPNCECLSWRDAALRAFGLYLGFCLANRTLELLILLAS